MKMTIRRANIAKVGAPFASLDDVRTPRAFPKKQRRAAAVERRRVRLSEATASVIAGCLLDQREPRRSPRPHCRISLYTLVLLSCPSWDRTRTLLVQSQACCQLHQGAIDVVFLGCVPRGGTH